jgi:hypothetical protein
LSFAFGIAKRLEENPNLELRASSMGISEQMRKLLGDLEVFYSAPNAMGLLKIRIASRDHWVEKQEKHTWQCLDNPKRENVRCPQCSKLFRHREMYEDVILPCVGKRAARRAKS